MGGARTLHIERKAPASRRWLDELRRAIAQRGATEVTAADAAAMTGLPLDEAERGLLRLAAEAPCRLSVSADGVLLFGFGAIRRDRLGALRRLWRRCRPSLVTLADRALAAVLMLAGPLLLAALAGNLSALVATAAEHDQKWLWPLVPPAFLLALFVGLFAVIGVAAQAAAVGGVTLVVAGFVMAWQFARESTGVSIALGLLLGAAFSAFGVWLGRQIWHLAGEYLVDAAWARRLLGNVRGLLFGPSAPDVDALADERRLVAAIRAQRGVVAPLDLMLLFGWSRAQADAHVARLLVDYGGDIVLDEGGAIAYAFDPLLETAGEPPEAPPPEAAVDVPCPAPGFFGGDREFVWLTLTVLVLGLVGLAAHPELVVLPDGEDLRHANRDQENPRGLLQGLGGWLHVAVLLCLGVRSMVFPRRRRAWRRLQARFELLRAARAAETRPVDRAPPAWLRIEVGADLAIGGDGRPLLEFHGHARDRALAERLRATRGPRRVGAVVFSA